MAYGVGAYSYIDRKKIRGSERKTDNLDASHAFSAWVADSGVTLRQEFVDD
jgi:hypothetical protein